mmetsp:Transcript_52839/g.78352  ORF Transcript_52839/g.78352 Transcript_52839/m.78352 type:complete len:178 (-) Transcript_52839:333-866(-)
MTSGPSSLLAKMKIYYHQQLRPFDRDDSAGRITPSSNYHDVSAQNITPNSNNNSLNDTHNLGNSVHSLITYERIKPKEQDSLLHPRYRNPSPSHPSGELVPQERLPPADGDSSCQTCLYTGVTTCAVVCAYFTKTALLDLPETGTRAVMREAKRQKRFLLVFAGCWGMTGVYRAYLG